MSRQFDLWILISLFGLTLFSLFNIFGVKRELFTNQLIFFLVGYVALVIAFKIGIEFVRLNSIGIYSFFIILLVLTFFIGEDIRGSKRWIDLYFFNFQPSEFFKPFFLLFIADLFAGKASLSRKIVIGGLLFIFPLTLILRQPDLGNAIVYTIVYSTSLFLAGVPSAYFILGGFLVILVAPGAWHFLKDYQKNRLVSFLTPELYSQTIAYNLVQAVITVGSGTLLGRGLALGTQSRFQFLPENHTDFAFASLVEQFGFVGGVAVLILFAIIIWRLLGRARIFRTDRFKFIFLAGVIMFLMSAIFINIGMNLGIMPVTGITLPLISYGGSSVVSTFIMLGLALSI